MKALNVHVLAILAFVDLVCVASSIDYENIKLSELPQNIRRDLCNIALGLVNDFGGSCLGIEPNYKSIELLLFTNNPNNYTKVNPDNPVGIDNNATLYVLTHGYLSGLNGYKIKPFRDKYVELYKKNVLFANWEKLAWNDYPVSVCNIPYIGVYIAKFLCGLVETQGFSLSNVHMIGHSLGGQLSGQVGKGVNRLCNQTLGKITALDPAGPLFQLVGEDSRLVPTDAGFVEVVHSNAGFFGYLGQAGTVDYHLNCGTMQPGCIIPSNISDLTDVAINLITCDHMRSVEIWPYVLESKEFKAKSCDMCAGYLMPESCLPDLWGANFISLGHTYVNPKSSSYYLETTGYPPFKM